MANLHVMSPPLEAENVEETFNPLDYVVDAKGNRWSGNPVLKLETIEGFKQVTLAQCKLMHEAVNIAINTRTNHVQVQTLLAARLLDAREVKTSADLPDLQIDTAMLPMVQSSGELPAENNNQTDWSEGEQAVQTGMRVADARDVGKTSSVGKSRWHRLRDNGYLFCTQTNV